MDRLADGEVALVPDASGEGYTAVEPRPGWVREWHVFYHKYTLDTGDEECCVHVETHFGGWSREIRMTKADWMMRVKLSVLLLVATAAVGALGSAKFLSLGTDAVSVSMALMMWLPELVLMYTCGRSVYYTFVPPKEMEGPHILVE